MAITAKNYYEGIRQIAEGSLKLESDEIKAVLLTSSYTWSAANVYNHKFYSSISSYVATGGAGVTMTGIGVSFVDAITDYIKVIADDVNWVAATGTIRYAVIYKWTGTAGTSPLIAVIDFGTNQVLAAQSLDLKFTDGIVFKFTKKV